jgi:hypothetical protein
MGRSLGPIRLIIAIMLVLAANGCGPPRVGADASEPVEEPGSLEHAVTSALIGCPHQELEIWDEYWNPHLGYKVWTATCRDTTFYCFFGGGIYECTEELAASP